MAESRDQWMDLPTLGLACLMVGGQVALFLGAAAGVFPLWLAAILGTLLMNLSFAIWHECSHANFSSSSRLNHALGVVSSFFSVYPGYFARRREHLAHHRWEGDPAHDPVYPRIQVSAWRFLPSLTWQTIRRSGNAISAEFMPLSPGQRAADFVLLALFGLFVLASLWGGFGGAVTAVFLVPRLAIFYLHAFYICYLPHARTEGGFERYRSFPHAPLVWRWLTVGQWAHGVHHRNPRLPWHRYAEELGRGA